MATVPSLPPPPLLEQAVTNPWPVVAILALAAIIAFFAFNAKGRAVRGMWVAGMLLLAGLVAVIVAFLVVTDREVLRARSAALTMSVAEGDGAGVRAIVHPHVRVRGRPAEGWSLDRIVEFVNALPRSYGVTGAQISRIESTKDGPEVGRTHVYVRVESDIAPPTPVVIRLDWQLIDGRWQVVGIEPLSVPGVN